jgi:putative nucleotidyltransferase with HDIG domain
MLANITPHCQVMLQALAQIVRAQGGAAHIVGGVVRDALMGYAARIPNVDLAVPRGSAEIATALAHATGGTVVALDAALGMYRVVVGHGLERLECDLTDYRAQTLNGDLCKRDFTLNAMAIALEDALADADWQAQIIDPCHGRDAVARGVLLPVYPETFQDDPLRILRGAAMAARWSWTFDADAQRLMAAGVDGLHAVAGERIRVELFKLLSAEHTTTQIALLDTLGVWRVLLPELTACHATDQGPQPLDVWEHTLEAVRQLEHTWTTPYYTAQITAYITPYLDEVVFGDFTRRPLIKLATLLHDIGKPHTRAVDSAGRLWFNGHEHVGATMALDVAERLKLSSHERTVLIGHIQAHLRPGHLTRVPVLTKRAIFRFFRDTDECGPGVLLVWMADRLASQWKAHADSEIPQQRALIEQLLSAYFIEPEEMVRPPRLVTGHDLMRALALAPGPRIGALLNAIAEAQVEGEIATTDEAIAFAKTYDVSSTA